MSKWSEYFFVFDLDDTLYKEYDYQTSGLVKVSEVVREIYGSNIKEEILRWRSCGISDIFGEACKALNLPSSVKEQLLWIYRNHSPDIKLDEDVIEFIKKISKVSLGVAILTDGRSVTQRLKANALGLSRFPLYISEEYCDQKPSFKRFEEIELRHPAKRYIYIGDNPVKDFKAPNELGWMTVGLVGGVKNIHSQEAYELPLSYAPSRWIKNLGELL